ncbi:MAG: flagellin lysine-N-methylase [Magnetococcales bacterium]|nr:flagellin lysine-N-methylase [Magnetococcales bacterium]
MYPYRSILAARAVLSFRCTDTACLEHCCGGWDIALDKSRYQTLKQHMAGNEQDKARFQTSVHINDPDSQTAFAVIHRGEEDGLCPFLEPDGLCYLHRRFSQETLPSICESYPRRSSLVNERLEVVGDFSCPEMVRGYLCDPHGADMEPADEITPPSRQPTQRIQCRDHQSPYLRIFEESRTALQTLLCDRRFSMASRLFQLAVQTHQLDPFFHLETTLTDEPKMRRALNQIIHLPEERVTLDREFQELEADPLPGIQLLSALLDATVSPERDDSYQRLLQKVFIQLGAQAAENDKGITAEQLWSQHSRRAQRWESLFGTQIDGYLERYAVTHLHAEWCVHSVNLGLYVKNLVLRIAMVRFLLFNHPRLCVAIKGGLPSEEMVKELEECAVEVFVSFSRTIAHNRVLLQGLEEDLREGGLQTLGHTLSLIAI